MNPEDLEHVTVATLFEGRKQCDKVMWNINFRTFGDKWMRV